MENFFRDRFRHHADCHRSPIFYQRQPKAPLLTLFLNIFSCGFLVGSYFLGSHLRLSLPTAVFSALASAASYVLLMLLADIPVLKRSRVYLIVVYILWCATLFTAGGILWTQRGGENFAAFTLFSVVTALFALGSLLPSENTDELLISLALPSSFAAGIIAVIVLLALLQADDCSCDCCDGGDCTDCCDCSPDFGQRRPKHTTMSDLSAPPIRKISFNRSLFSKRPKNASSYSTPAFPIKAARNSSAGK